MPPGDRVESGGEIRLREDLSRHSFHPASALISGDFELEVREIPACRGALFTSIGDNTAASAFVDAVDATRRPSNPSRLVVATGSESSMGISSSGDLDDLLQLRVVASRRRRS